MDGYYRKTTVSLTAPPLKKIHFTLKYFQVVTTHLPFKAVVTTHLPFKAVLNYVLECGLEC